MPVCGAGVRTYGVCSSSATDVLAAVGIILMGPFPFFFGERARRELEGWMAAVEVLECGTGC
jgi:uncharacterized membrane protein